LEAGLPQKLDTSSYIRLLNFDNDQIDQFFKEYGLSNITFDSLKSYLKEEDLRKPLFCWMFAIMTNSQSDSEKSFKDVENPSIKRALVYQGFIHSIIRGKHKHTAEIYHWTQYYPEEKSILRKIAALSQIHNRNLTKSTVIEGLKNYGIIYDEKMIKEVLEHILTSYFYLRSTSASDMSIDFIHKSFGEYLLAEYYIESIFEDKVYCLSVGIPSQETIEFLDGLLELLNKKESSNHFSNLVRLNKESSNHFSNLVESLGISQLTQHQISISDFIERVRKFFEEEQIIFQMDSFSETNKIVWKSVKFPAAKYGELWIHRWISHYISNKLAEEASPKETLVELIQATSHTVPSYLRRLVKADLSSSDLPFVNLAYADLSRADLSHANLSGTNLSHANLAYANLSGATLFANLSYANIAFANLTYANLSDANLSGANLFHANLAYADLSDANLSGAILAYADLSNADLSNSNLSNADLHNTNLSNTKQKNAILPPIDGEPSVVKEQ